MAYSILLLFFYCNSIITFAIYEKHENYLYTQNINPIVA